MSARVLSICLFCSLASGQSSRTAEPTPAENPDNTVNFARDIQPVLSDRCYKCHGIEKQKGGLRLDDRTASMRGGDSGKVIQPGNSAESLLYRFVAGLDPDTIMPPKGDRLTAPQIKRIKEWIDAGAVWPEKESSASTDAQAKDTLKHWAFAPPKQWDPPPVSNTAWVRNCIDRFILARLDAENLEPSPEADRSTLIRRLSFDLRGLPPTIEEVEFFKTDTRHDAYDRLVDRMLASPRFGERWARHWLDLARYADSDGYEKDSPRPYAYLFRDWVIAAINRDLPFDQFSIEQLAGDLLPGATDSQRTATGFHRNTLTNKEGGVDQEEFRCKATVDRVNTTGTVWLGLTIGCAECHSHKYDPITQREFYQLFAFFNNASEEDIPAPRPAEIAEYRKAKQLWDRRGAELAEARGQFEREHLDSKVRELDEQISNHRKTEPKFPPAKAQTLAENTEPRQTYIHIRGDFLRKGDRVEPGTPEVLHPFKPSRSIPNRLDLAEWLFEPANPLTARVTVNRVWQHLFGGGLSPTASDFGTRGKPASHPKLLDWLATTFRKIQWSRKELIRLIVSSATYRQSSRFRPELASRDPNNTLLARQNRFRLEAEIIRDASLTASGLLNSELGGPSIHPPLPADIAALGYANSVKWKESEGGDRYRRGLYIFFQRTVPYPMLAAFDAPDSNVTCAMRDRSNTPLQALTLMNDPVFFNCAQALARRIANEAPGSLKDRIRHAFKLCLARNPSPEEAEHLAELYRFHLETIQENPERIKAITGESVFGESNIPIAGNELAALIGIARTLLNLDEFVTRD